MVSATGEVAQALSAPFADEPGGIAAAELAEEREAVADDDKVGFNVAKRGQQAGIRLKISGRQHTSRDLSRRSYMWDRWTGGTGTR